jgi:exonuclease III
MVNGTVNYDIDRLSSLSFNPLFKNFKTKCVQDLDPDTKFYDEIDCNYYLADQFNDALETLLCLAHKFSIIGLSETWLNENSCLTQIPGYNFISQNRIGKSGGGVACYLDNKYHYKIRSDLNYNDCDVSESLFIEIINPTRKNIIVGIVYRAPNNNSEAFITVRMDIMSHISQENKTCYILGDMNLNLVNNEVNASTGKFLDSMLSFMMLPLITKPSRNTANSATLIDNIFANDIEHVTTCGLLFTDITDHFPVFAISNINHNSTSNSIKS